MLVIFINFQKLKGALKGKGGGGSAINPVAMGKALIAKANFTPSKGGGGSGGGGNFSGRSGEGLADIFTNKDGSFVPNKHRAFLMDTQVKYTIVSRSHGLVLVVNMYTFFSYSGPPKSREEPVFVQ